MMRSYKALLVVLPALLLVSCIESQEELRVHPDLSANARFRYRIPTPLFRKLATPDSLRKSLRNLAGQLPSLHIESLEIVTDGGNTLVDARLRSPDLHDLAREIRALPGHSFDPGSAENALLGHIDLKRKGLGLLFSRRIDPAELIKGYPALLASPGLLGDSVFSYTIHLPKPATSHNAHSARNNGRTLHWRFPLAKNISRKETFLLTFQAPFPLPSWLLPSVTAAVLLLLSLVVFLLMRGRKRRALHRSTRETAKHCSAQ